MATTIDAAEASNTNSVNESPYIKEIQKNIRNITKKLTASHKIDAIIAENAGVSLDDLVAQKKINADQRASALKKPQLQAQLAQLEEQIAQYRKFETESQGTYSKQTEELKAQHVDELAKVKEEAIKEAQKANDSQLRSSLLVFSQFLRAAAAKRSDEDSVDTEESKAFEGVLLLVYGGDQASVDSAIKIIEGSDDKAPSIDGTTTTISYAQIKKASVEHSPFQNEEAWVDSVAEAQASTIPAGSDPTLVNAGLTEQQDVLTNGVIADTPSQPLSTDTSNAAADRWDSTPAQSGDSIAALEESYEVIPRPEAEVDVPSTTDTNAPSSAGLIDAVVETSASKSWADQVPDYAQPLPTRAAPETDGFQEVAGRSRGGRGRGGHSRGDGEHRGRGRGGRGGPRGGFNGRGRGDGEFRGRGGRARGGPRGDAATPRP